jgi:E3 ubiquitin-protein ligase HECTD1
MFSFLDGFNQVFSIEHLRCFNPHELKLLLCGNQWPSWTLDELLNYIESSHGFTRERFVKILVDVFWNFLILFPVLVLRSFLMLC